MSEIVLISDNKRAVETASRILSMHEYGLKCASSIEDAEEMLNKGSFDVILFDFKSYNIDISLAVRKFQPVLKSGNIRSILLLDEKNINYNLLKYADGFIQRPFDDNLFYAAVYSQLQARCRISELVKNNNDLSKSLYQMNVLYEAGAQLTGSIDKAKLIDIMTGCLEQSLSLSLCYSLIINSASDIRLTIKSLFPVTPGLENAIKLRALLSCKNLFSISPEIKDINVSKFSRDPSGSFGLNVFGYDNLSVPVNIDNKFYGIIEVFRETDFTQDDAKCFSAAVKQASLPLESAVLYEDIEDKKDKLEKLEHVKSEFISIVSHELKTPLTSIKSAIDIVLASCAKEAPGAAEKFLDIAKRNTSRLEVIIKDLLDFSKIEAGKLEFKFEKTNINLPAEMVKNALDNLAKERNITINLNLASDLDSVYIDAQRIEQVLTNLISNALKFTPENGRIEVSSSEITGDDIRNNDFFTGLPGQLSGKYIQIAVKDSGIGIAKENWNRVFEQFRQIENPLTRKAGGSGLGLSISKRLIDAHRGFIWLNSKVNEGTSFYIAIPVMSDREIFEFSLEQDMAKSKQDKTNIALFSLNEKIAGGKSLTDTILREKILRGKSKYKDFAVIKDNRRYYYSYAADMESCVYVFELRRLETYLKSVQEDYKNCDIMYSSVLYPRDADSIEDIKAKLNQYKGISDEENTDCR